MVVQQGRVVSTGHRGSGGSSAGSARSVVLPRSQKEYLEQHILRKREAEVKRLDYWSQTSRYYETMNKQSERYNGLSSEASRRTSIEAAHAARTEEEKRQRLAGRRERLGALLARERREQEEELRALPSGVQPITDLRLERERLRREREDRNKAEAELKMLQHWKINNPQMRAVESERSSVLVRKMLQEQMKEKKDMEEEKKREEAEFHRRAQLDEERKRRDEERKEKERQEQVVAWRGDLEAQMAALREREREVGVFQRIRAEQEEIQQRVEGCEASRKRLEERREGRQLETYQRRQHKLKLRQQAKVVQEELEEDRARLQEMGEILRLQDEVLAEKKAKAVEEVGWMRGVLEQQQEEERRREQELDNMFAEEAEAMWEKQEEVWRREAAARRRLMGEVTEGWKRQGEERLEVARRAEQEVVKQRQELEQGVKELHRGIQEAERKEKEKQVLFVEGLDEGVMEKQVQERRGYAAVQEQEVARRRQEIREDNMLARQLAGWHLKEDQEPGDFRRRKVRWFY